MLASLRQGFAQGTRRNLATQKQRFLQFCHHFARRPFPASLFTLCLYTQHLSRTVKSVDTILNYLQGIKLIHQIRGLRTSQFEHKILRVLIRGLRRVKRHVVRQALPITPRLLLDMHSVLQLNKIEDVVFWAICLLAFFSVLRKSNLVPNSPTTFNSRKQLTRADVICGSSSMLIRKRWAKTIQYGQRALVIPIYSIQGSVLCPVKAYTRMCALVPSHSKAPAFAVPCSKGCSPYTYWRWQGKLKDTLRLIGRNPNKFSSHSFRRGGATFAFKAGASAEMVKILGDWRSDSFRRYLHLPLQTKTQVAKRIRDAISQ